MFTSAKAIAKIKNVVGWKNHYDTSEVPALNPLLNVSESSEYFQDFHPAMRLDIIKGCIPSNWTLDDYLKEKREIGVTQLLGEIVSQKQYEQYAKKTLASNTLIDRYGWYNDTILNNGRFVGFRIKTKLSTGLTSVIKKIGIQVTAPQSLDLYVYHSSKMDVISTITMTIANGVEWNWKEENLSLIAEDETLVGGEWIIGYYQDDLVGQAITYKGLNWLNGPCATCDGGQSIEHWRNLQKYMQLIPFYVPGANLPTGLNARKMFDLNDCINVLDTNWGMNFNVTVECDLTDFFIDHRLSLKKGLALKVVSLVLKDIQFSQQINYIEESLRSLIIRDLEGDKDTNYVNIADQLAMEIKAINFDHSKKSAYCLPCNSAKGVNYGVA